jgi:hypothetical protein
MYAVRCGNAEIEGGEKGERGKGKEYMKRKRGGMEGKEEMNRTSCLRWGQGGEG